jgi:hypothetical protein
MDRPPRTPHAAPLAMRLRHVSSAALSLQATPFTRRPERVLPCPLLAQGCRLARRDRSSGISGTPDVLPNVVGTAARDPHRTRPAVCPNELIFELLNVDALDVEYGASLFLPIIFSTPNSKFACVFAASDVSCQVSAMQRPARFRRRRKNAPSCSTISTAVGSGSRVISIPLGAGIPR